MTFIPAILYKTKKPLITMMSNKMNNNKNYNPIIGSNLGIPLNLLQFIFTTEYYNHNIIDIQLITLQFCIGIFTYGTDRLNDALDYKKNNNIILTQEKREYYDFLLNNPIYFFNLFTILSSFIFIISITYDNIYTYPFFPLLLSTLNYRDFKKKYGYLKPFYIATFWTLGTVFLPTIIHDHNYDIINYPNIYLPSFLSMLASSNLLDIKDLKEDESEKIYTIPVLFGENNAICISHFSLLLAMIIFINNENYYDNLLISTLFQFQTFGTFFLNYNTDYIIANNTIANNTIANNIYYYNNTFNATANTITNNTFN